MKNLTKSCQKPSQKTVKNTRKINTFFCEFLIDFELQDGTKITPKTLPKKHSEKQPKKQPKNVREQTCLSKGTGSALIVDLFHVNVERLPHRLKTSIAPLARSLRSERDSHYFPINSSQVPKKYRRIPYKIRTNPTWIPINSQRLPK